MRAVTRIYQTTRSAAADGLFACCCCRRPKFRRFSPQLVFLILIIVFMVGCTLKATQKSGVYHEVRRGEYLWRIAKTYRVDMKAIMAANRLSDPNKLRAGQQLFIPGAREALSVEVYRSSPTSLSKGSFIWPVNSKRITSRYGMSKGKKNKGIDIAVRRGTRIAASQSGTVAYEGTLSGYGKIIIIDHHNGYSTVYAHNSRNWVKVDEKVNRGQIIGQVGSTGRSTGPHLYFEVRKGYKAVDPLNYLP